MPGEDAVRTQGGGINPTLPIFHKGDDLYADDLNAIVNAIRPMPVGRASGADVIVNGAGTFVLPLPQEPGILIYNSDNSNVVPAYGIVLQNGIQTTGLNPIISTKQPDTFGCQYNAYVNSYSQIGTQGDGLAQVGPMFTALYDSADGTPAAGELWGPRSGTFKLKKNTGGFEVVGVIDSTNHLVLVRSAPMLRLRGVSTPAIPINTTGTVEIWWRTGATTYSDTGATVSALNDLDAQVPSNADVELVWEPYGTEGWKIVQSDFNC
jgi:hypothetical protein